MERFPNYFHGGIGKAAQWGQYSCIADVRIFPCGKSTPVPPELLAPPYPLYVLSLNTFHSKTGEQEEKPCARGAPIQLRKCVRFAIEHCALVVYQNFGCRNVKLGQGCEHERSENSRQCGFHIESRVTHEKLTLAAISGQRSREKLPICSVLVQRCFHCATISHSHHTILRQDENRFCNCQEPSLFSSIWENIHF